MHSIRPAFGVCPASHGRHVPSRPAWPTGQFSQALRSAFGCAPSSHLMHAAPSALYIPSPIVEQSSQSVASAFGCWPGEHVEHDCMSSAPPVSSLCRCVPSTQVRQCVAPTSNAILFGSLPTGQYLHLKPTSENFPGTQTSQTVFSKFGARPLGHSVHSTPVADTQPRALVKISVSVQATQRSAMIARVAASMRGCVPRPHCSQIPSTPAWPAGHVWQAERVAVGMVPSAHAWHNTPPPALPVGHARQVTLLSSGSVPAGQPLHVPFTPAVPSGQGSQKV